MTITDTYLVADVGGTNTRIALTSGPSVGTVSRFANDDYDGIGAVISTYLADWDVAIAGACIDVAGPVSGGVGRLTNRDWSMSEIELSRLTGASHVAVLNDLQAQGYALAHLAPTAFAPVLGQATGNGARLVVNVGTGFNIAPVHSLAGAHVVPACEAGHITLPVQTADDLALSNFLAESHGMAAVEDVLSGRGLANVYAFLTGKPVISAAEVMALIETDPNADAALKIFIRTLGTVCGDLALSNLPYGGIALVGGVARACLPHMERHWFETAFRSKGRFSAFMADFAIEAVIDDHAGLTGCAAYLHEQAVLKKQIG